MGKYECVVYNKCIVSDTCPDFVALYIRLKLLHNSCLLVCLSLEKQQQQLLLSPPLTLNFDMQICDNNDLPYTYMHGLNFQC